MVVFPCHFQILRLCSSPDWWRHLPVVVLALFYLTSRSECRSTIKYEKSFFLVPNRIFSSARAKRYLDTSRIFHFDNFNFYALSLSFILKLSLLKHRPLTFRKLNLISLILISRTTGPVICSIPGLALLETSPTFQKATSSLCSTHSPIAKSSLDHIICPIAYTYTYYSP